MSTGRNQKSSSGTRGGVNKMIVGTNLTQGGVKGGHTQRAQAIQEAYNSNKSYIINNQVLHAQQNQAGYIMNQQVP